MTLKEKIDYLKADKATRAVESVSIATRGGFDLAGQFSPSAVREISASATATTAIHAANVGSSSLGVAHDLIGCVLAGEDGTSSCNHSGVDHIATARQCLDNYSNDQSARDRNRDDATGDMMMASRIRFEN